MQQEIQVTISIEGKVHLRTFRWRLINFNPLWLTDLKHNEEQERITFTSEVNASLSKEQIEDFLINKSYFTDGEGLGVRKLSAKLIEVKEEKEIYEL
jgi:hypothetical protein